MIAKSNEYTVATFLLLPSYLRSKLGRLLLCASGSWRDGGRV